MISSSHQNIMAVNLITIAKYPSLATLAVYGVSVKFCCSNLPKPELNLGDATMGNTVSSCGML